MWRLRPHPRPESGLAHPCGQRPTSPPGRAPESRTMSHVPAAGSEFPRSRGSVVAGPARHRRRSGGSRLIRLCDDRRGHAGRSRAVEECDADRTLRCRSFAKSWSRGTGVTGSPAGARADSPVDPGRLPAIIVSRRRSTFEMKVRPSPMRSRRRFFAGRSIATRRRSRASARSLATVCSTGCCGKRKTRSPDSRTSATTRWPAPACRWANTIHSSSPGS